MEIISMHLDGSGCIWSGYSYPRNAYHEENTYPTTSARLVSGKFRDTLSQQNLRPVSPHKNH